MQTKNQRIRMLIRDRVERHGHRRFAGRVVWGFGIGLMTAGAVLDRPATFVFGLVLMVVGAAVMEYAWN